MESGNTKESNNSDKLENFMKKGFLSNLAKSGESELIELFMIFINENDKLNSGDKIELFKDLDQEGKSIIYYALINNHSETVKTIFDFIMKLDFYIDDKKELLNLDNHQYILYENINSAKRMYIKLVIKEIQFSRNQRLKLLMNKY